MKTKNNIKLNSDFLREYFIFHTKVNPLQCIPIDHFDYLDDSLLPGCRKMTFLRNKYLFVWNKNKMNL